MNQSQIEALLIDQAMGELTEEGSALLDAYLESHPELAAGAGKIRDSLDLTARVVAGRPDLFRVGSGADRGPAVIKPWLKAAAVLALLGLAAGAGFVGGQSSSSRDRQTEDRFVETPPPSSSPWARYQFEENGQLAVMATMKPSP